MVNDYLKFKEKERERVRGRNEEEKVSIDSIRIHRSCIKFSLLKLEQKFCNIFLVLIIVTTGISSGQFVTYEEQST